MSIKYRLSTADVTVNDHGYEIHVVHGERFFRLTHFQANELARALDAAVDREVRRQLNQSSGQATGMAGSPAHQAFLWPQAGSTGES